MRSTYEIERVAKCLNRRPQSFCRRGLGAARGRGGRDLGRRGLAAVSGRGGRGLGQRGLVAATARGGEGLERRAAGAWGGGGLGLLGLGAARARGDEGWGQGLGRRGLGAARAWGGGGLGRRGLGAARACLVVEVTSKTKKTIQQRSKTKKTKTKSPAKQRNLRGRHEGCGFLHPHGFGNQRVSNHKHYPRPRRWTLGAALSATSQMDAWAALSATSQMDAAALSATSQMDADTRNGTDTLPWACMAAHFVLNAQK